ncbi:virulence factor TspB C-terminal domain-related protein [Acinetobacter corruptisaponis]|uniref:Virulence factor TspB C-terminal domain-related protein n=1 Tax=Acinetobacter corruptisaponis TaxID=3045147 RepID=A0ABY8S6D8_9GAMM|nr:virulence factor TspB C-terminal domain-related protein [Acinetobacter sp. KCTC 92772]WHP06891.1 virulence factor TspB C-terminal domain-related protein [Acinetobacter sp. KCTC 92772]
MANRNNICTRFINYAAVLILLCFSSLSFAYTGGGGQFGGGGASGSWEEPDSCPPQYKWTFGNFTNDDPEALCRQIASTDWIYHGTNVSDSYSYCVLEQPPAYGRQNFQIFKSPNSAYDPNCNDKCPAGYEKINGKCQPKKCPVGQVLVNGQCKQKQCPIGQMLDKNGICAAADDDKCPAGQTKVNGRCITPPPDQPDDPDSEWPPFCEWASIMCQWHEEWQQWSNDYAANEEKANLDREELKRIGLDSKENLDDIKEKIDLTNDRIENANINNLQFYEDVREFLRNYDSSTEPTDQFPELPVFCDWANIVCEWYIDWKVANIEHQQLMNDQITNDIDLAAQKMQQDQEFYAVMDKAASNVVGNQEKDLDQNKDFFDKILEFIDWYKDQSNTSDPSDPNNPSNEDGNVSVDQEQIPLNESQRIQFVNGCPADEQFTVNFMGQSQNLGFSYQPLCQFMSMIRPFVIAIAYLIGAYILMGLSRGSSE